MNLFDLDEDVEVGGEGADETTNYPEWLTNLINRLMVVFAKVFAKLGIKLVF